ncbi:MAG: response regulator [bacterium]|nr:response regulator [bacterium]
MLETQSTLTEPKEHHQSVHSDLPDNSEFTILVIDDDPSIRGMITLFMEDGGFTVLEAENGKKGADMAIQNSPSLIISDIRMPEMDGIEMIEKIRSQNCQMPVIFMTGYTEYESLSDAIQFQPLGFLHKPFEPNQLLTLVKRAVDLKRSETAREDNERELETRIANKTGQLEFKTERLEAEKELLRGIMNQANFGLVALDTNCCVHFINVLAVTFLQVSPENIDIAIGAHYKDSVAPLFHRFLENQIKSVVDTQEIVENDFYLEQSRQRINVVTYAIRHNDRVTAFVFVIHDITEKDNLQRKLSQTAKLASIGELAAGVAHEINNPLGFVNSNCNTLKEYFTSMVEYSKKLELLYAGRPASGDEKQCPDDSITNLKAEYDVSFIEEDGSSLLNETVEGLDRVSKIVMDLKAFARVDSETMERADINKLIDNALNLVRNETKYKLEICKSFEELPEVLCFPGQLIQVFTNLFINASHAVKDKGTLTISSNFTNDEIVLTVTDTGSGIPEANLAVIFDPFFTTKEPGKGTGMGLSISYGIIEKHDGSISVESEIDKGTTFTIKLPVLLEQPDHGDGA